MISREHTTDAMMASMIMDEMTDESRRKNAAARNACSESRKKQDLSCLRFVTYMAASGTFNEMELSTDLSDLPRP